MRKACGMYWGRREIFVMSESTRSLRKHRYGRKKSNKMDLQEILW